MIFRRVTRREFSRQLSTVSAVGFFSDSPDRLGAEYRFREYC